MRLAILLGDFFWSSIPYDGLCLFNEFVRNGDHVDLLMFENDIRLNKKFRGDEMYRFDPSLFRVPELRTIGDWNDLARISSDYDLIISSAHIAPKTRYPHGLKKEMKCPMAAWDIGGTDILTNAICYATYFFVKGPIWRDWLETLGVDPKNVFVTGSPHYAPYLASHEMRLYDTREEFGKKHGLDGEKEWLFVAPSNPKSHQEQFKQNYPMLEELCARDDIEVVVKTYPGDYLFYESEGPYTGVYRRRNGEKPQYQQLKDAFPDIKVVQSQEHYSVMIHCDRLFNMSGSSISWESFWTGIRPYSMNFVGKPYHLTVSYLPDTIVFPDVDIHVESVDEMFSDRCSVVGLAPSRYFIDCELSAIRFAVLELLGAH